MQHQSTNQSRRKESPEHRSTQRLGVANNVLGIVIPTPLPNLHAKIILIKQG